MGWWWTTTGSFPIVGPSSSVCRFDPSFYRDRDTKSVVKEVEQIIPSPSQPHHLGHVPILCYQSARWRDHFLRVSSAVTGHHRGEGEGCASHVVFCLRSCDVWFCCLVVGLLCWQTFYPLALYTLCHHNHKTDTGLRGGRRRRRRWCDTPDFRKLTSTAKINILLA